MTSSTGTDLIIEVDDDGKSVFEWWATENGFESRPHGQKRILDKFSPHDLYVYPTLYQTTHVRACQKLTFLSLKTHFLGLTA